MSYPVIYLVKKKEAPILRKHHWIFSGAIKKLPEKFNNGEICQVRSSDNRVLGHGYFNSKTTIAGRMLNFSEEDPLLSIEKNIRSAIKMRKQFFDHNHTNAYRLINGEGDQIPGLLIDRYNEILVIQVSTLGIEKLKKMIIDILTDEMGEEIELIFERSTMNSRKNEGLAPEESFVWSKTKKHSYKTNVLENDHVFEVDVKNGHKTGFYLDQRNMRAYVASMSQGKKVLNCFSYTGGFSVYAAQIGAKQVASVDISDEVIALAAQNFDLNELPVDKHEFIAQDVFEYLESKKELDFGVVILDPPAFAKKKEDVGAASSGYRRLNFETLKRMKSGSVLITCSCSYHVDAEMFLTQVRKAAQDANRTIRTIQTHRHAEDHVLNPYHPELDYLKSFVFYVE